MEKIKVMSVFGTRPEAIKMAPLVKALEGCDAIESGVCLTGQHREMLDSVMQIFRLHGDYDLNIMEKRQTLSTITCKTLLGMEQVFEQAKPDLILVHGDTSTTFAGALAAFYHQVKVGHVEAGLRTWDKYSPFPEEMNRTLVGDIADLHFSPTKANAENLKRESIMGDIFITGNTAIDAMRYTVRPDYKFSTPILNELDFGHKRILAETCHRSDPIDVEEMHNLIARCFFVLTDSGGLQEEAPALGKPVLVMRRETERPEAIAAGTAKLVGVEQADILREANALLHSEEAYAKMAKAVNPYGDGHASERIVQAILWHFGRSAERPRDFLTD